MTTYPHVCWFVGRRLQRVVSASVETDDEIHRRFTIQLLDEEAKVFSMAVFFDVASDVGFYGEN